MIKSMTGFGKATGEVNLKKITVEIKSLNSKQADIFLRMPSLYKDKELSLRSLINQNLERGKIDFNLYVELSTEQSSLNINVDLFKKYYADLSAIAADLGEKNKVDLISIITKMPDIMKSERMELDENEWLKINEIIEDALHHLNVFRTDEGKTLFDELFLRISNIEILLKKVDQYEQVRIETVKERILTNLAETIGKDTINKDRFEQELIYYLEKYDVSEEKTRLNAHLNYFKETMNSTQSEGKKLGFITQEIGREINTLGSKANHADLQKIVVEMKDELEKIKEQVLNIL
ncbi:MAG: YicC family protein [Flavobacteriales bacterium CG_4_10_14_0_2_um_filter_32_8]|nr:MAG: YicC family protein [Flavobacteriales bacterium CG_4_10_14_0_2_um_filter_32_8]PJB14037.1 MAG: YicC family protein [Flavobacteriales bacterium CG_4_9_14_3_um_filter_32_8]